MVLQGNVESKKPRQSSKGESSGAGGSQAKAEGDAGAGSEAAASEEAKAQVQGQVQGQGQAPAEAIMVPGQPVALPADWASHGTIALVSHGSMGGITVIHTEMPPGTQLQPIVTTDATGTSVISLDGATIQVPFSMAHAITPVSTVASAAPAPTPPPTTTTAADALDVSMSEPAMALTELCEGRVALRTACVLEAAVSQTLLAPGPGSEVGPEGGAPPAEPGVQAMVPCEDQSGMGQAEAAPPNAEEASVHEHKDSSVARDV